MQAILDQIATVRAERVALQLRSFRELVAAVADGTEQDATEIDDALQASGKTPTELAKAVELLLRRRALVAQLDAAKLAVEERVGIHAKLNEAGLVLHDAQQKYDAIAFPLRERLRQIEALHLATITAENELRSTCTDVALRDRLRALEHSLRRLEREGAEARNAEHDLVGNVNSAELRLKGNAREGAPSAVFVPEYTARLEQARVKLAEHRETMKAREAEVARVVAEQDAVCAMMLTA